MCFKGKTKKQTSSTFKIRKSTYVRCIKMVSASYSEAAGTEHQRDQSSEAEHTNVLNWFSATNLILQGLLPVSSTDSGSQAP